MKNFKQILNSLTQEIRKKYPTVDIVPEHRYSQESEGDVYQSVNILCVPESIISDVEDYAYGILRIISPEKSLAVGFSLFTPEETAKKFPQYVRSEKIEFAAQTTCRLFQEELQPSRWQVVPFAARRVVEERKSPSACFDSYLVKATSIQLRSRRLDDAEILGATQELAFAA